MKRKIIIPVLCAVFAAAPVFAACGSASDSTPTTTAASETSNASDATTEASGTTTEATQAILGGWTVNMDTKSGISDEDKALFEKAAKGTDAEKYTPVACIATQVVAGTNHAFLCADTEGTPPWWHVVTVYESLDGKAEIIGTTEMDPSDIYTTNESADSEIVGGWAVVSEEKGTIPDDAQKAFTKAIEGYVGVGYTPVALLATQVVSGMNYRLLCAGTPVTPNGVTELYVVDVYEDTSGKAEITDAQKVLLTEYVGIK